MEMQIEKGHINGAYQTNNGLMNAGGFLAGNVNNITFDARVNNTLAHAYQNKDDGYVFNTQFNNFNAAGSVGLLGKWGYSQLHASYFELRTGIAEGAKDEEGFFMKSAIDEHGDKIEVRATDQELRSYTPFVINQLVKHSKLVWDNSISIGESRIVAKVGYQQNSRQENNDITRANTSIISYLLNTVTYDLRYLSPTWDGFNFSAGVSGMYQNSKNKGILLLIPQYNLFDIGGYAIANKTINKLSLSAGVRYDSRKFKGQDNYVNGDGQEVSASTPDAIHRFTAYNSDFNGVSASIGGALQLSNNAYIKLNVARGFRAPNVAESGSNGIKDGTVVYEIGNPKLKPENSLQIDFTPGIRSKDVTAELSLFYNRINNFIYVNQQFKPDGTPISDTSTPGFGPAPVFSYQQNDAVLMGGEAVIDLHPSGLKWFDWYNSFSVVNAQLQNVSADSLKAIPFTPPARLRSEIILSNKHPHKGLQNYYFKFGVFHSFEQTDVYQLVSVYKEIEGKLPNTPAYTLLNAGFGTDFVSHGKTVMSLAVSIDNLADVSYVDYLSRYRYYTNEVKGNKRVGIYNMGRNISFKVNVPLQFSSGHHSTVEHGNAAPKPTRDDE
ncbi:MAG: TonB-dependent receptor [Chitinophagia bacterium]|nr:TonB-dependent receptor [Chitinophagia bacterium]